MSHWTKTAGNVRDAEGLVARFSGKTAVWTLAGDAVKTGRDGLTLAVIMPTALHGVIRFVDGVFKGRKPIRYEDASPPVDEQLPYGWNPLTEVLCVATGPDHEGQLVTYTGASWGTRRSFERLVKPYVRKGEREFPVCELGSRELNDDYGDSEPLLIPVSWLPRDRFPDLLPAPGATSLPPPENWQDEEPIPPPPMDDTPPPTDDDVIDADDDDDIERRVPF
jgi:hypothetical protein